ncbi:branched-chain amino acid ABC transporter permease [Pseudonocardia sp. NPDC049154]|uniref:branched-chain amino acid ABC transporter permease n=1 Tax=Pseudonocardia sp. NPDC049154 TaxID=3155501 RepID=UPI0033ECD469
MELFETSVILGVTIGLVYALSGAGLVVIYRTSGYASFTQGDIAAVSLYVGLFAYQSGLPYPVMAVLVVAVGALVGGLIGGFIVVPLERYGPLTAALATIGVGLAIQGTENIVLNPDPVAFPSAGDDPALTIGPVTLSVANVVQAVICIALFAVLGLAFRFSRTGIAMRAANDNPAAAGHVGLPGKRLKVISWVLAGGLAGITGLFVAPLYSLSPTSVNAILVFGFATVVLGGFESITGALVAGVIIGVASNLVAAYLDPQLVTFGVYALVLCVLLFRPYGLLGRRPLVRV